MELGLVVLVLSWPTSSLKGCLLCVQTDGEGVFVTKCDSSNIGYEGVCNRCTYRHAYIGETSRTGYTRNEEHWADYRAAAAAKLPPLPAENTDWGAYGSHRKTRVKSWMWEHAREIHGGVVGANQGIKDFSFKVTRQFSKF